MKLLWPSTVFTWATAAAGIIIAAVIHERLPGAAGGVLRYWGVMVAVALSLALTAATLGQLAVRYRYLAGSVFILVAGFALLAIVSASTVPTVSPTGGGIVAYAFYSVIVSMFAALTVFFVVTGFPGYTAPAVAVAQVFILAAALFIGGGLGHCRLVDHWDRAVPVSRLTIAGGMSIPLVEDSCAFVLGKDSRLYSIDLAIARKKVIAKLPRPEPEEAGFPHLVKSRDWLEPLYGKMSRLSKTMLQVEYPYNLEYEDGTEAGLWTFAARVDVVTKQTTWQIIEERPETEHYMLAPVSWGGYTLAMGEINLWELSIEGPGVKTVIWQKEELHWLAAAPGRLMAATKKGTLYIIDVSQAH